jgi:hypothetical protein
LPLIQELNWQLKYFTIEVWCLDELPLQVGNYIAFMRAESDSPKCNVTTGWPCLPAVCKLCLWWFVEMLMLTEFFSFICRLMFRAICLNFSVALVFILENKTIEMFQIHSTKRCVTRIPIIPSYQPCQWWVRMQCFRGLLSSPSSGSFTSTLTPETLLFIPTLTWLISAEGLLHIFAVKTTETYVASRHGETTSILGYVDECSVSNFGSISRPTLPGVSGLYLNLVVRKSSVFEDI